MKKLWILMCLFVFGANHVSAQSTQTATVSGFIYDASNGEALIGANVFIENTLIGSSTNLNGYYPYNVL